MNTKTLTRVELYKDYRNSFLKDNADTSFSAEKIISEMNTDRDSSFSNPLIEQDDEIVNDDLNFIHKKKTLYSLKMFAILFVALILITLIVIFGILLF